MTSKSFPRLKLMLIDPDPAFRAGFILCLEHDPGLQVLLEAESAVVALSLLRQRLTPPDQDTAIDLVILSLDFPSSGVGQAAAIELCQSLHNQFPTLPILAISATPEPSLLAAAFRAGAMGYCQKGTVVADFVGAIRQVAAGYSYWNQGMEFVDRAIAASAATAAPQLLARWRRNLRQSGLNQIDRAIAQLSAQLTTGDLTAFDELFLAGRRRELRAARWCVDRLLATAAEQQAPPLPSTIPPPSVPVPEARSQTEQPHRPPQPEPAPLVAQPQPVAIRSLQAALFDATFAKLGLNLRNLTPTPLEIDILRDDRKRELLTLVLRQLEEILADLRFSQVDPAQLPDKQAAILRDLWRATVSDFFGRYYTLMLGTPLAPDRSIELVDILLQDQDIVQSEILNKIPLVSDFVAHLLFQMPLTIDDATYAAGTVEAMSRMETLLQNLTIQVANATIQPLLNRFGDVVAIKQNFYDRRLLSSREIERFRNDLSWKYRIERYFGEPTAIFESRYRLLVLQELGIVHTSIYAPRNEELDQLAGVPLAVTIALETRDAIAPRLRSAISFVGSGVVYVLTEVIGRGIGLIGRGIIKGVGNVVQDTKFSRNSEKTR